MPGSPNTIASDLAVVLADVDLLELIMAEESQLLANEATDQRVFPDIKTQHIALEDLHKGVKDLVLDGQTTIRAGQASIQKGHDLIQHGNAIFHQAQDLRDEISLQVKEIFEGRRSSLNIGGRGYSDYADHQNESLDEDAHYSSQLNSRQESQSGPSTPSSFDFVNDARVPRNYAFHNITIDRAANAYQNQGPSRSDHTATEEDGNGHQHADTTAQHHSSISHEHATVDQRGFSDHHNVMSIASLIDPSLHFQTVLEAVGQDTVQPSKPGNLKRGFPDAGLLGDMNKKLKGDQDPENYAIYQLRNKENKGFDEVAKIMNKRRLEFGKTAKFTSNAIYSRYKRNATQIAAALGETFKACQADVNAGTAFFLQSVATDFDSQEDDFLLQAYVSIHKDMFTLVSQKLQDFGGRVHTPEMCANRLSQLGYK